ncbi:MAG: hypothetical protein MR051_00555 [Lentisphaeria bacterium]|nr:hypothetical protein [Lentisphaeria bacterium]
MRAKAGKWFAAVAVTSGLLLCGCGTTGKFVYPAKMETMVQVNHSPVFDKKVAVVPFDDYRDATNTFAPIFLVYIPLVPFGWVEYNRPEAARDFMTVHQFDFTPSEDLPKAAALSLRRSRLFADAFFTFGGEKDRADFVLYGAVKSTKYLGHQLSYGLSILGSSLWLLGLPAANSRNELGIELTLKHQEKVVWERTFSKSDKIWHGWLYHWGYDVQAYSELMQSIMNEAIADMAKTFREHPELLNVAGNAEADRHGPSQTR